jgi:curved DNA-binding protein CbpA
VDDLHLAQWASVIDRLNHYEVLSISFGASIDEIRKAFSEFADSFHPDGHRGRTPGEQAMVLHIYKRGTEAYRVLTNPALRERYDAPMRQHIVHPPAVLEAIKSLPRASQAPPGRLIDRVKAPAAKPFVMKALQLRDAGQFKKAKLELTMAINMDRGNTELSELMAEIEREIAAASK